MDSRLHCTPPRTPPSTATPSLPSAPPSGFCTPAQAPPLMTTPSRPAAPKKRLCMDQSRMAEAIRFGKIVLELCQNSEMGEEALEAERKKKSRILMSMRVSLRAIAAGPWPPSPARTSNPASPVTTMIHAKLWQGRGSAEKENMEKVDGELNRSDFGMT